MLGCVETLNAGSLFDKLSHQVITWISSTGLTRRLAAAIFIYCCRTLLS